MAIKLHLSVVVFNPQFAIKLNKRLHNKYNLTCVLTSLSRVVFVNNPDISLIVDLASVIRNLIVTLGLNYIYI